MSAAVEVEASPSLSHRAFDPNAHKAHAKKSVVFHPFDQKSTFICKFCGGKKCHHEDWRTQSESAIRGLNSDWITNNIIAIQRPSTRIIKEYKIIEAFKEKGINAIFNLQEPGEHPFCGDGIHAASGFSYYPEEFYDNGIYFFNFGWKDMTATSTDVVLRILKNMSFSLTNGGKVAVHCHAGRGRTGLIIAAWLIYNDNMSAKDAIKLLREKRKGAISKKSQEKLLYMFEKEVKESRIIFFSTPKYGLDQYLFHQRKLTALSSESVEKFVPKVVVVMLDRLETLLRSDTCKVEDILYSFYSMNEKSSFNEPWGVNQDKFLKQFKDRINTNNYEVSDIDDPRYLAQVVLDFLDNFAVSAIEQRFMDAIGQKINGTNSKLTSEIKDHFFKEMNKKEFFLLETFARFFAGVLALYENIDDMLYKAVVRVCISLVSARKKLDKLFMKRSLIGQHDQDDQVTHLKIFLLKWIENFNEGFTKTYMLHKSALRINEKKIMQKLVKKGLKRGSYLSKVLDTSREDSDSSPADTPHLSQIVENSPNKEHSVSSKEGARGRKLEEGKEGGFSTLATPLTQASTTNSPFIKLVQLPEIEGYQSKEFDISANTTTTGVDNSALGQSSRTTHLPQVMAKSMSVGRFHQIQQQEAADNTPRRRAQNAAGTPINQFSARSKDLYNKLPRKSLLRTDLNEHIQENVSALAKVNIERHYDNLFGINELGSGSDVCSSKDFASKTDISDDVSAPEFVKLLNSLESMGIAKQDALFQRLLELQIARNSLKKH